ncbi:2-oxoglutarate synthase, subunit gamma [Desulfonema limicola]|uniref:2-oxoglutarate synthase, subunit gamma n=1 Tax=Desulfonema limicola TaxID=45656 RepID=A0A975B5G0_9BACT|nr:2-oxoacid:acceptor oxidoreductase family protein [Desulfonema limicola]QTA79156.1 2-oxoglutarate synthase, subunit gamma [Desulfonema limicola]
MSNTEKINKKPAIEPSQIEPNQIEQNRNEIIITGFGGQGIVLAGRILGMAAALGDKKESTLVQSYGPESRGGACCAQVIISDTIIQYPYIKTPDVLICMSQSAYEKYKDQLKPQGRLLTDKDLVNPDKKQDFLSIPATRMAEELGRTMMANIIMLGFAASVTSVTSEHAMKQAVISSVPKGTEDMNLKAFARGFDYGLSKLKGIEKKSSGKTGASA